MNIWALHEGQTYLGMHSRVAVLYGLRLYIGLTSLKGNLMPL